jgi:hypothetical protein
VRVANRFMHLLLDGPAVTSCSGMKPQLINHEERLRRKIDEREQTKKN